MPTTIDRTDALVERLFGATLGALELFSVYLGSRRSGSTGRSRARAARPRASSPRARGSRRATPASGSSSRPSPACSRSSDAGDAPLPRCAPEHARVLAHARRRRARRAVRAHARRDRRRAAAGRRGLPDRRRRALRGLRRRLPARPGPHQPARLHARAPDRLDRRDARHPRTAAIDHGGRVADIGCGQGFSTIAVAHAFPNASVDGIDLDPASIADATRHTADAGLDGRVRFRARRRQPSSSADRTT